jgi:Uri superfamily endonuclease
MAKELCLKKEECGSYVLVLNVKKPCRIKAGKLPERELRAGIYLYIGRAKRYLRGRLVRHLRKKKKLFWHIDYLLQKARIKTIWCRPNFFDECQIASEIMRECKEFCSHIHGFGASDCLCPSHLIYYYGEDNFLISLLSKINLQEVRIDDIDKN